MCLKIFPLTIFMFKEKERIGRKKSEENSNKVYANIVFFISTLLLFLFVFLSATYF